MCLDVGREASGWACPACTLINEGGWTCGACELPRPNPPKRLTRRHTSSGATATATDIATAAPRTTSRHDEDEDEEVVVVEAEEDTTHRKPPRWQAKRPDDKQPLRRQASKDKLTNDETIRQPIPITIKVKRADDDRRGRYGSLAFGAAPAAAPSFLPVAAPKQRVPPPVLPPASSQDWPSKYQPSRIEDVCVHSVKSREIVAWFQAAAQGTVAQKILVLHGPTGCCKSALVQAIVSELKLRVRTWTDSGHRGWFSRSNPADQPERPESASNFVSALDDFRGFLHGVSRFPALALTVGNSPIKTESPCDLVILDGLPHTHNAERTRVLHKMLIEFVRFCQYPAVFLVTLDDESSAIELQRVLSKPFIQSRAVACIKMNPVAPSLIRKALKAIADKERAGITKEEIDSIVTLEAGDLRHAILMLQFASTTRSSWSITPAVADAAPSQDEVSVGSERGPTPTPSATPGSLSMVKDPTFSYMHRLGKVLRAKRLKSGELKSNLDSIVEQSGDLRTTADILLENYPGFFGAVADMAKAVNVLADADIMSNKAILSASNNGGFPDAQVSAYLARFVSATNTQPENVQSFLALRASSMRASTRAATERVNSWRADLQHLMPHEKFSTDVIAQYMGPAVSFIESRGGSHTHATAAAPSASGQDEDPIADD